MENKNKKLVLSSAVIGGACLFLVGGAFALFTSRTDSDFQAKAGNVVVGIDKPTMTNSLNINPGDNDPTNPKGSAEGTEHKFSFTVSNLGNKSIRTRHTLILSCFKNDELLDARYLSMFDNKTELVEKSYILSDDTEIKELNQLKEGQSVKAIKYVYLSDIFEGHGTDITDIEKNGDAEKEDDINIIKTDENGDVKQSYTYDMSLLRDAPNKYQNSDIKINVVVEAMQYRNTEVEDWKIVTKAEKTFSTANVKLNVAPATQEKSNGEELDNE